jgi:hypothetical protein
MGPDAELMLLFIGLHVAGLLIVAALLVMFLRAETTHAWSPPDDSDGGGGGGTDRPSPPGPAGPRDGGLPLPDALPARFRLRDETRLRERFPGPPRRPAREPARPPRQVPAGTSPGSRRRGRSGSRPAGG